MGRGDLSGDPRPRQSSGLSTPRSGAESDLAASVNGPPMVGGTCGPRWRAEFVGSNSVANPLVRTYVPGVGHRERLRREIAQFMKAYGRVADRNGPDPNDRHYSRRLESEIKRMRPEELDRLLRDVDDAEDED